MSRNPIMLLAILASVILFVVAVVFAYYTAQWWLPVGVLIGFVIFWAWLLQ